MYSLSSIISVLPESSGVYIYLDRSGTIIYIGKAKNIKKRVTSYFSKKHLDLKTEVLVQKIRNIEYILTESEESALFLENNLIKKHQPKYNVLLKDDKTYPWIVVKNEPFPRILFTRKKDNDTSSHYYGPYTSTKNVRRLLFLIYSIYPIRTCKYSLSQANIKQKKNRSCLQYHIKKCLAPCIGLQSEEEYNKNIHLSEEILKGKYKDISQLLYKKMIYLANEMRFEEAEIIKKQYTILNNYYSRSIVSSRYKNDIDVFSYDENKESVYINCLHIIEGVIINGCTIEYKKRLNESRETILAMGIIELRLRFESNVKEIIVPFYPDMKIDNLIFTIPRRGEKKKFLCLSEKNVQQYKINQVNKTEKFDIDRSLFILKTLKNKLNLKKVPLHIECFDNSNIQGCYPVSSCIVFKKAKPSKKDYRHFNIKTVNGINDYGSIHEVIFRRYNRLIEEHKSLPDLIVIDGGKGQLNAAIVALKKLGLYKRISIISIAKRLEEIYFPNDPFPLFLNKNSEELKLIQKLRDEAHRFGITFHRKQRNRNQLTSVLDDIYGIGIDVKKKLLRKYTSIEQIKNIPKEEIVSLIGVEKTRKLLNYLLNKLDNE